MITLQAVGKPERTFEDIFAAYRYIKDTGLQYWTIFEGEQFVMASDNSVVPEKAA